MISGQSPRMTWRQNFDGKKRTIEEAKAIAKRFGVYIPDDVDFFEDEENELPENMTARGPKVTKPAGSVVYWSDLINGLTGRVPFLVRPNILTSDEAIVAVFGHELYELEALRDHFKKGKTTVEHFINYVRPDNPGNLHDEAWDHADELVDRMRKGERQ